MILLDEFIRLIDERPPDNFGDGNLSAGGKRLDNDILHIVRLFGRKIREYGRHVRLHPRDTVRFRQRCRTGDARPLA